MRHAAGFVIALALGQPAFAQKAPDLLALEGSWAGSYTCQGTAIPIDLSIAQNISYPNGMSATFRFGGTGRDASNVSGEFFMKVTRLDYNNFLFEPTRWVLQPDGVEWFSMRGHAGAGGIAGSIDHPLCTSFVVYPAER